MTARQIKLITVIFLILNLCQPGWAAFNDDQPTVLITGANRGLGLEFARQYAEGGWNVIASCRKPAEADELNQLAGKYKTLVVEKLDVTSDEQVAALADKYQG